MNYDIFNEGILTEGGDIEQKSGPLIFFEVLGFIVIGWDLGTD